MHLLVITRKVDKYDLRMGFFFDWILAFAKEVNQLSVICLEEGDSSGLPENIRVYSMGKERGKNRLREFVRFIYFLLKLIPSCEGVFVHMIPLYVFISGPFARLFRKPLYLWYTHGRCDWRLRAAQVFVTGYLSATKESFPLKTGKPIIAFGHALNLERFPWLPVKADDGKLTITTASRITSVKNLDVLIRAVKLVTQTIHYPVQCDIIGIPALPNDQKYLEYLKHLVEELDLGNIVHFLGSVPNEDLVKEFFRADVYVNLSDTHSLDKAVLEPMACGVIPISSNHSIRQVFAELANELMVECTPEHVAEKIIAVWNTSREEQERVRRRLREIVERDHNMKVTIPKIVELYRNCK